MDILLFLKGCHDNTRGKIEVDHLCFYDFSLFSCSITQKLVNTLLIFLLHQVHSKGHKICEFKEYLWIMKVF